MRPVGSVSLRLFLVDDSRKNRLIPLFGVYRDDAMEGAAIAVLRSGQIATGHHVALFESAFSGLIGMPNVVSVNDASSAIQIALRVSGVGAGDEVLTTSYACMSTNAPIATSGGTTVWVDVNPLTGTMDPASLERAITDRSKVVILYHTAGYPAQTKLIADLCQRYNLRLIEDCNTALLASSENRLVGVHGDFAVFSFYPNRQINATEGGALVCRSADHARHAMLLRRFGIDLKRFRTRDGEIDSHCDVSQIGWAATLNNLCAAVANVQVQSVGARISRARNNAVLLRAALEGVPGVTVVNAHPDDQPAYWTFLAHVSHRDRVLTMLKNDGIASSALHARTDRYAGFGRPPANLIGTDAFMATILALPCGWWLDGDDMQRVASKLIDATRAARR